MHSTAACSSSAMSFAGIEGGQATFRSNAGSTSVLAWCRSKAREAQDGLRTAHFWPPRPAVHRPLQIVRQRSEGASSGCLIDLRRPMSAPEVHPPSAMKHSTDTIRRLLRFGGQRRPAAPSLERSFGPALRSAAHGRQHEAERQPRTTADVEMPPNQRAG